jgi:hypothetical protein
MKHFIPDSAACKELLEVEDSYADIDDDSEVDSFYGEEQHCDNCQQDYYGEECPNCTD